MVAPDLQSGLKSGAALNALLAGRSLRPAPQQAERPALGDPNQPAKPRAAREPDRVELSPESRRAAEADERSVEQTDADPAAPTDPSGEPLSDREIRKVEEMKQRDAEVRAHEQAHVAAAGALFRGGPTYQTEKGPDGNDYVVSGSVSIDSDPVPGDPEATIAKMQQVRRAALAPAEPSSTDRRVAAQASRAEAGARQELAQQRAAEQADQQTQQSSQQQTEQQPGVTAPEQQGGAGDSSAADFSTGYTAGAIASALELPRLLDVAA